MSRTALAEVAETPFRRIPKAKPHLRLEPGTYSTAQVAAMSGASLRQLQWWDERGFLKPEHEGHTRIYDWLDVAMATMFIEVAKKGVSRHLLYRKQKAIREILIEAERMIGKRTWLATDGKKSKLITMLEDVEDFSKPVAVVYLTPILRMVKPLS